MKTEEANSKLNELYIVTVKYDHIDNEKLVCKDIMFPKYNNSNK